MVSRYVTNGPVKQEGLCIMPPPPTHYRMMPPQRKFTLRTENYALHEHFYLGSYIVIISIIFGVTCKWLLVNQDIAP